MNGNLNGEISFVCSRADTELHCFMKDFFIRDQISFPPATSDPSAYTSQVHGSSNPLSTEAIASDLDKVMVLPGNPEAYNPNREHLQGEDVVLW